MAFEWVDLPKKFYKSSTLEEAKCAFDKERDIYLIRRTGVDEIFYDLYIEGNHIILAIEEAIKADTINGKICITGYHHTIKNRG